MEGDPLTRETLRAELTQLKLDLVDRLTAALDQKADKAQLEGALREIDSLKLLAAGRTHLPEQVNEHDRRIGAVERRTDRMRWAVPSTAGVAGLIALAVGIQQLVT